MSWVTRFYPKAWRARYGREFDALLEDAKPGWRGFADVLWGAMKMRLETMDWRMAAAFGLAGLAVAALVTIRTPDRYRSAAVLQMRPGPDSDDEALMAEAWRLRGEAVSRSSLSSLIQEPLLNLYPSERKRMPIEDVIRDLKARDLKIDVLPDKHRGAAPTLRISYWGPDAWRARRMVQALTRRLVDEHLNSQVRTARLLAEGALSDSEARAAALRSAVEVVNPASLPDKPVRRNWWAREGAGFCLGLLFCIAVFGAASTVRRFPRAALGGFTGAIVAGLISPAIPRTYESSALLQLDSVQTRDAILRNQTPISGVRFDPGPAPRELVIRVRASDRFAAQKATQDLLSRQAEALASQRRGRQRPDALVAAPWLQVVDPASLPVDPVSHLLPTPWWMIFGGLIIGTAANFLLMPDPPRQRLLSEQFPAPRV